MVVLALTALTNGLGNNIFSNYFNEVFHIDEIQRGFIEIPRESPGILCMLLVAALGFMGNLWMSAAAQVLILIGFVAIGWYSPSYGVMLAFMFIHSLGMHLFMPLNDAISMDLAEKGQVGATLGRFKSVNTLCNMLAAVLVFFGFRTGFFSFQASAILPFVLGAAVTAGAVVLLAMMALVIPQKDSVKNHRLLFRKQYMPYYMVTLAYGCQKRIRIVFAAGAGGRHRGSADDRHPLCRYLDCSSDRQNAGQAGGEEDAVGGGNLYCGFFRGNGPVGWDAG